MLVVFKNEFDLLADTWRGGGGDYDTSMSWDRRQNSRSRSRGYGVSSYYDQVSSS